MLEDFISAEEIQRARTPEEFIAWFEQYLNGPGSDNQHREQILLRRGIAKTMYEEVFPLYRLLQHQREQWANRTFRNVIGSQSYDVEVAPTDGGSFSKIEITVADADQAEALRMEEFVAKGHVSALGPVTWTGTKRTGRSVTISDDAQSHVELVRRKRAQIQTAAARKCAWDYPTHTALLISFDDYVAFADPDDTTVMEELLADLANLWRPKFARLWIVGNSGKRLWSG